MKGRPGSSAAAPAGRHAVVVGGSVAGQCAGLALARDGWRVTVVERSAAALAGGTGISIDRRLLSRVTGIDAGALPVIEVGFPATAWELLQALLSAELQQRPGVRVQTGVCVQHVRTDSDRAETLVATSGGDIPADLVIGADGHSSTVRRFVSPDHPDATYSGYVLWRGLIDESKVQSGFTPARGLVTQSRRWSNWYMSTTR